jgi:hypothetical protein
MLWVCNSIKMISTALEAAMFARAQKHMQRSVATKTNLLAISCAPPTHAYLWRESHKAPEVGRTLSKSSSPLKWPFRMWCGPVQLQEG